MAILISIEEFELLRAGNVTFTSAYEAFRNTYDLAKEEIDPECVRGFARRLFRAGDELVTPRYLLDTNVISEPLRPAPNQAVLEHLREHQAEIAIASVVWHELWYGCYRLPTSTKRTVIEAYLQDVVARAIPILVV